MITKKKLQQQVNELTEKVKDLSNIIVSDELNRLRRKEKEFANQTELLSNVRFKIKNVKIVDNEDGFKNIIITYQLPMITLELDENGKPKEKVPFFYSVNALEMIGLEDYEKIEQALEQAKNNKN